MPATLNERPHDLLMGTTGSQGDSWSPTPDFPAGISFMWQAKQRKDFYKCYTGNTWYNNSSTQEGNNIYIHNRRSEYSFWMLALLWAVEHKYIKVKWAK